MKTNPILALLFTALVFVACNDQPAQKETQKFEFQAGYPTAEASEALYDEMDYHRATQAYIWATPMLNSMGMREAFAEHGVTENDRNILVFENSLNAEQIWMTANSTTPYFWTLFDLSKEPIVAEVGSNDILGGFYGHQMQAIADMVFAEGTKFLVVGPEYTGEVPEGFTVVQAPSNITWWYGRANHVSYKGQPAIDLFQENLNFYPLSQAGNPPAAEPVIALGDTPIDTDWDKGYKAWENIHAGMQIDNIRAEDKIMYDFLKGLGIEHGKDFNPNERQKKILERAAETGHKMVQNLAFNNRSERAPQWGDKTQWVNIVTHEAADWNTETTLEVTDRTQWYQLVANAAYLYGDAEPAYGKGSDYLSTYKDVDGNFFNGSKQYKLIVPAEVPVANFWSVTVYDNETRSMIDNEQGRIARGSTDDVVVNADGTTTLYFGNTLPEGAPASNWVQTNEGDGWFVLFRFYGPEKPFYDKSFMLNDFEKID